MKATHRSRTDDLLVTNQEVFSQLSTQSYASAQPFEINPPNRPLQVLIRLMRIDHRNLRILMSEHSSHSRRLAADQG
jgi:hypothetical protein